MEPGAQVTTLSSIKRILLTNIFSFRRTECLPSLFIKELRKRDLLKKFQKDRIKKIRHVEIQRAKLRQSQLIIDESNEKNY